MDFTLKRPPEVCVRGRPAPGSRWHWRQNSVRAAVGGDRVAPDRDSSGDLAAGVVDAAAAWGLSTQRNGCRRWVGKSASQTGPPRSCPSFHIGRSPHGASSRRSSLERVALALVPCHSASAKAKQPPRRVPRDRPLRRGVGHVARKQVQFGQSRAIASRLNPLLPARRCSSRWRCRARVRDTPRRPPRAVRRWSGYLHQSATSEW